MPETLPPSPDAREAAKTLLSEACECPNYGALPKSDCEVCLAAALTAFAATESARRPRDADATTDHAVEDCEADCDRHRLESARWQLVALRDAVMEEREACARIADESCDTNSRIATGHETMPPAYFADSRTQAELVATFAHIAHEAHDIAAAIRQRASVASPTSASRALPQDRDAATHVEELGALVARLRLEAEGHAQEARTQRATVHAIYQLITKATGEPGNWHGAEPVREALDALYAQIANLTQDNVRLRAQDRDAAVGEIDEWLAEAESWLAAQSVGAVLGSSSALSGIREARASLARLAPPQRAPAEAGAGGA